MADYSIFGANALTGGGDGKLDAINGNALDDGDMAVVIDSVNNKVYIYTLEGSSGASESSPEVISPDTNAGDKRWILCDIVGHDGVTEYTLSDIGDKGSLAVSNEWTATQNFNETSLTDGATINWDLSANQVCNVTLAGNRTMAAPTNNVQGATYILRVIQDATGGRTLAWNAEFLWGPAGAPDLATAASDVTVFAFYDDGTSLHGQRIYNES
jgi:hypothetical protein